MPPVGVVRKRRCALAKPYDLIAFPKGERSCPTVEGVHVFVKYFSRYGSAAPVKGIAFCAGAVDPAIRSPF